MHSPQPYGQTANDCPQWRMCLFSVCACQWKITNIRIINGNKKCKVKNKESVALLTLKPPQTQITILGPKIGTVEIKLVITVAPQKDIWPQGNT